MGRLAGSLHLCTLNAATGEMTGARKNRTHRYFYFDGKRVGTSPTMPDAPAPPQPRSSGKKGCGGVGKIIMVVVAVVATVWTAGAALAYFAPAGTAVGGVAIGGVSAWSAGIGMITGSVTGAGLGVMVGAGAIGGAVGSIAAQGAGIATGVQDGFSWKGVALGAISGAVSGGMGYAAQEAVPGLSALRGSGLQATVGRQVLGNAIGQGVGVVTGLQQRFDWKGVAASAASGYVSAWAGGVLPESMGYGRDLASRMAGGLVTTAVRGGSVSRALPGIIGDALGSTVGNALGDSIAAANGQGRSVPGPIGAEERATIMGYFADGPGVSADSMTGGAQGLRFGSGGYGFQPSPAVSQWNIETEAGISAAASRLNAAGLAATDRNANDTSYLDMAMQKCMRGCIRCRWMQ